MISKGFTLIEALLANVLLVVAVAMTLLVVTRIEQHDRRVRTKMSALRITSNVMADVLADEDAWTKWNGVQLEVEERATHVEYRVRVSIAGDAGVGGRRVTVRTSWEMPSENRRREVALVAWSGADE